MALKEYRWRGSTWQIADEDLHHYPGAELIVKAKDVSQKRATTPQNKSRRAQDK